MADEIASTAVRTSCSLNPRLDSWKEIAAYLGREVRTVQRWERHDGLPVHRLQHRKLGSVFAYASELNAWREARDPRANSSALVNEGRIGSRRARAWPLLAAAGAILTAALGLFWWASTPVPAGAGARVHSLAVLPLEDLSQAPTEEYFADGITEALIGRLSSLGDLRVISRISVMQFKGRQTPVPQIAKVLGVEAVVDGSVRRIGDRVRITAHLVRADTGENLWTGSYDREVRDVLKLQSEVAQVIAAQIQARVTPAARVVLREQPAIVPEAYESYLKARFHLNGRTRNRTNLEESVRFFQEAIDRDPTFAPAYAGLAAAHQAFGTTSSGASPVADLWPKVIAAATKALDLNPRLAEAHSILARTYQQQWRWADAEEGYRRALEADPNNAAAHLDVGGLLTWLGRTEEGLAHARRGRALDPLSTARTVELAWILYHARRYDAAIDELRNVLIAEPERGDALWFLGFALTDASRPAEAIQTLEHLAEVWNRSSASLGVLTRAYARAGRLAEAHQIVEELERRSRAGYVPPAVFVNAYVGINDRDRAFRALERAYNEHSNIIASLTTHPLYDPLRDDPRFAALLRRVGLN